MKIKIDNKIELMNFFFAPKYPLFFDDKSYSNSLVIIKQILTSKCNISHLVTLQIWNNLSKNNFFQTPIFQYKSHINIRKATTYETKFNVKSKCLIPWLYFSFPHYTDSIDILNSLFLENCLEEKDHSNSNICLKINKFNFFLKHLM